MRELSFQLLGSFAASYGDKTITKFRSAKAQAAIAYLLVERDRAHPREKLLDLLWPGLPAKSARTNLRQVLYQLRSAFPEIGEDAQPLLVSDYHSVQLNPEAAIQSDVATFAALLAKVRQHQHDDVLHCQTCQQTLQAVADRYSGTFLAGFNLIDSNTFEDWLIVQQETYQRRYLDALDLLGRSQLAQRQFAAVEQTARRQIAIDNLREGAYRQLFEVLARGGQRNEALAQYERLQQLLQHELGMSPTQKTEQLAEAIANDTLDATERQTVPTRGYELLEQVGEGAFGVVHRADQPHLGREVAVKIIKPELANRPNFIRRFETEAQTIAQLEHPYIVPLYDYWREPNSAFLILRYLEGGDLRDALAAQGAWQPEAAARLVNQIGSALAAAHRKGILHRDIKPANILLDAEGNAFLTDFSIGQTDAAGQPTSISTSRFTSPEQRRGEVATERSDCYAFGLLVSQVLLGNAERPNGNLPPAVSAILQRATAANPAERFASVGELAQRLQTALASEVALPPLDALVEGNPYKGLRAFQESDSELFFGRTHLIEQLLNQLSSDRFLAVVGPSGSGKSSVVRAGVLPQLRSGLLPDAENWFTTTMIPGTHPLEELEAALLRVAVEPPESLIEPLQKDERGLIRTLKRILPANDAAPSQLLLVIDQFEELFTLSDDGQRQQFMDNLLAALDAKRSQLRVIVTLRADFYDKPLQVPGLAQHIQNNNVVVAPLTAVELEQAIVQPAALAGVRFADGLVTRIVDDVRDQPGILPLLQYALTELFERRQENVITLDVYEAIGGVTGALGREAERIYGGFSAEIQVLTRQIFLRLITLGEGAEDTRRRVLRSELEALVDGKAENRKQSTDNGKLATNGSQVTSHKLPFAILSAFGDVRLLSFDHDPISREPTVEVAHEALLREWPRLRGWLDESHDDVRFQRMLSVASAEWRVANHDRAYLLHGSRLTQFADWYLGTSVELTRDEIALIEASGKAAREQERAEEVRQRREVIQAQKLAETERQRAEEQTLAAGRLRQRAWSLTGVTVLALVLAMMAFTLRNQAVANFESAEKLRLAAQAEAAFGRGEDIVTPALLSLLSLRYGYSPEADAALTAALRQGFSYDTLDGHTDAVAASTFANQSDLMLTGANDNTALLWDTSSGQLLHRLIAHSDVVSAVAFSADDTQILTGSADRSVHVWDVMSGAQIGSLPTHGGTVWALAVSPDGSQIVTNDVDDAGQHLLRLWDSETMAEIGRFFGHGDIILTAAFSVDGRWLISGGLDRTARVFNVASGELLHTLEGHASAVSSVALRRDNSQLLSASYDNTARLWNLPSGDEAMRFLGHIGILQNAAFTRDEQQIVTASEDATTRFWEPATGLQVRLLEGSSLPGAQLLSANGQRIMTADFGGTLRLWQLDHLPEPIKLERPFRTMHAADIVALKFSADDQVLYTGNGDGTVQAWQVEDGALLGEQHFDSDGFINDLAFSPNGQFVVTTKGDGTLALWEFGSGQQTHQWQAHEGAIWTAAFAPDSLTLLTGGADGVAHLWDIAGGRKLRSFVGHGAAIMQVAFSADGKRIATASRDAEVRIWETSSGAGLARLVGHDGAVAAVFFAPSDQLIVTGSEDTTARLWNSESGEELQRFVGHTAAIEAVAITADGTQLLTGSTDFTARLWDLESGELLRYFEHEDSTLRTLAISADSQRIATGDIRFAHLWHSNLDDVVAIACEQLPRKFSDEEKATYQLMSDAVPCDS